MLRFILGFQAIISGLPEAQVFNLLIPIKERGNIMNNQDKSKSVLKSISRRNLLVWLGIFLGITLIGISTIKEKTIRTINRFRVRSIEQIPQFDPDT